jgi:hypothetical protein
MPKSRFTSEGPVDLQYEGFYDRCLYHSDPDDPSWPDITTLWSPSQECDHYGVCKIRIDSSCPLDREPARSCIFRLLLTDTRRELAPGEFVTTRRKIDEMMIPVITDAETAASKRLLEDLEQAIQGVTDSLFGIFPVTESVNKAALKKWIRCKRTLLHIDIGDTK